MVTETAKFFQTEHIDEIFSKAIVIKDGIPLPLEIELSVADACTRSCFCCPRGKEEIAPNTSLRMTPTLYKKLANELKELGYKGLVMCSGFGEPLIHKDIADIVREFNFTYIDINTNGDLLTREKLEELKEAGINKVLISVYEEESLPKFQEMSNGFENIVIIRKRYDHFDRLYNNRGGAVYEESVGGLCYYPFYLVMVGANGDCFPCCHEWQRRLKIGNLYQHTFWEVWTSQELKRIREKILEGKRDLFPCRICNVDGRYRGGENFELYTKRGL